MKAVLAVIGSLAVFLLFIFLMNLFGFFQYSFFQPRVVSVQNKTFHESQPYNDGMARELEQIRFQYIDPKTTSDQKAALRGMALHDFAAYDINKLPGDLQLFYSQLQSSN